MLSSILPDYVCIEAESGQKCVRNCIYPHFISIKFGTLHIKLCNLVYLSPVVSFFQVQPSILVIFKTTIPIEKE